jgi:hypothetical protein
MNWSRYKLLLITGALTLLIAGGSLFYWMKTSSANQEIVSEIGRLESDLKRLSAEEIFPSEESKEALEAEQKKVAGLRDELMEQIQAKQITPPTMARTLFGDYVRGDLVPRLRQSAQESKLGGEQGVILDDNTFGLSAYLVEGQIPEATRIPSLMVELETMAHLSELLFNSGISELISIQVVKPKEEEPRRGARAPFGLAGAQPTQPPQPNPVNQFRGPQPPPGLPGATTAEPEAVDPKLKLEQEVVRLFEPVQFRLTFKMYEDFLWSLMNNVLKDPNQLVVKSFRITNGNENLWPRGVTAPFQTEATRGAPNRPRRQPAPVVRDRGGIADMLAMIEGNDAANEPEEDAALPIAGLKDRRQRMTGGEMLNVQLDVVLYRLKPQNSAQNSVQGAL